MLNVEDLRRELIEEAHCSRHTIHPGGTKMDQYFWWMGMKKGIVTFVLQCLVC